MAIYDNLKEHLANTQAQVPGLDAYPEIRGYLSGIARDDRSSRLIGTLLNKEAGDLAYKESVAGVGRRRQADELSAQLQALKDKQTGEGYKRVLKDDGGFDFFDNEGNPITVTEYARAKNKNRFSDGVLGDSENRNDIAAKADYNYTKRIIQAAVEKDTEWLTEFKKGHPEFARTLPADLVQNLKKTYPTIFEEAPVKNYPYGLGYILGKPGRG